MGAYDVDSVTIDGGPVALGTAGSLTVTLDRPAGAGGSGRGFSGGQLLNLAVAACISNDLHREAVKRRLRLTRVAVHVRSDDGGDLVVSTPITYDVEVAGEAEAALLDLVAHVDRIAEIPNSLRGGTAVLLGGVRTG